MDDPTLEDRLVLEQANSDRLRETLELVLHSMRDDERDMLKAQLVSPRICQLTLGDVIDGAIALHEKCVGNRHA